MEIINWAPGVNRNVTNEASISIGQKSVVTSSGENGSEMTRLSSSGAPDVFQVTIWFSNSVKDSFYKTYHKTEWNTFLDWFKYESAMGSKPFYFHNLSDPSNTNPQVYKISSNGLPTGTPNGEYIKCSMRWNQVLTDSISVEIDEPTTDSIIAIDGQIDVLFTEQPSTTPSKDEFTVTYQKLTDGAYGTAIDLSIEDLVWDGFKTSILYFHNLESEGQYKITVVYKTTTLQCEFVV